MEKHNLTQENTLGYALDKTTFNAIQAKEMTTFEVQLREESCLDHLVHIDGTLVLEVEELPKFHYGVYYYNDGTFPYAFNENLQYLMFVYNKKRIVARITERIATPGVRFKFQDNAPSVQDDNGDCTIWSIVYRFELLK